LMISLWDDTFVSNSILLHGFVWCNNTIVEPF